MARRGARRDKRQRQGDLELFARCAGGFEDVLAGELRALRMRRVRPQVGGVIFFGSRADAYRACLWLRSATRVQMVLARVGAHDADALYQGVAALPWEKHVAPGATIAVNAHGANPELRNTQFVALKVKDAVCDRLREARGERPNVDGRDPDLAIDVAVHPAKATVYLNLSGASLHRRGYREEGVQTEAPLKETLASGILLAAGWPGIARAGGCLADPMCGSGTFSIEAALMAAHIAPGLLRERWGFEGWVGHDPALWEQVRDEAAQSRRDPAGIRIVAGDLDESAVAIARSNARRAGVEELVSFAVDDAARMGRRLRALPGRGEAGGLLVANPPYGRRLLSDDELPQVNRSLAAAVDALPQGWATALVTPDPTVDTALGRMPTQVIETRNGPIRVWVRLYAPDAARLVHEVTSLGGTLRRVPIAEPNSAQFAARLRKVGRERARWARKAQVTCYRVYDADLPDYALSVDLYTGVGSDEGRRCAVVTEHRRPSSVDELRATRRLADAVALCAAVLDVPEEDVVCRPWQDARSKDEEAARLKHRSLEVVEGSCHFTLDLARPEAVLPLSQRAVRELVSGCARDARVAALFATSGAAIVRAASAGAAGTVIVDGASAWLEGVRRLMQANGHVGKRHRSVCVDVRTWLRGEAKAHRSYDLVICMAPAWLPARDAGGVEWNLGQSVDDLVRGVGAVLAPGGRLVLSFDDRGLRLDRGSLEACGLTLEDMGGNVVPHDFERSREVPRCLVLHKG